MVDSFLPFRGVFSEHHRMEQKMPQWIHAFSLFLECDPYCMRQFERSVELLLYLPDRKDKMEFCLHFPSYQILVPSGKMGVGLRNVLQLLSSLSL